MKGRKADFRATTVLPALGFRRGVSNTPIKRPGRGERLFDGRVPVGRMQYAPTSTGLVGCRQDMRERFFILPPFRKADFRPSTALTFWGKPIASRQQPLLFEGSELQAVNSKNFLRKANCKPSTVKTFWGKLIASRQQQKLFEGSELQAVDSPYFLREAHCKLSTAKTFWGKRIASRQRCFPFKGSELQAVHFTYFLREANCISFMARPF